MNPKIQDLKDKLWTEEYWTNPNTDKLLPAQLNKFAELIVRECITVINQPNGVGDDDVIRISRDVKKHFGVEE